MARSISKESSEEPRQAPSQAQVVSSPGNTLLREIPVDYAPLADSQWLVIPDGPDAGKRLFFFDTCIVPEGCDDSSQPALTVVFVHGNPECSYTYRKVISELREKTTQPLRIVAMDHIGFGLSDQASYEMVEQHHAANLLQLVQYLDLQDITLVIHDWGGPIGVGALMQEPERVSNLMVLNTTVFPIARTGMTFENYPLRLMPWSRFPDWVPNRWWGIHSAFAVMTPPRRGAMLMVHYLWYFLRVLTGFMPKDEVEAQRVFCRQFGSEINAVSSKRFVYQTPVWGHGYRYVDKVLGEQDNTPFYRDIQERLPSTWGPDGQNIGVKGVFGTWDPLAKTSVLEQWQEALPQMTLRLAENTSHFVEEHRPDWIAEGLLGFADS